MPQREEREPYKLHGVRRWSCTAKGYSVGGFTHATNHKESTKTYRKIADGVSLTHGAPFFISVQSRPVESAPLLNLVLLARGPMEGRKNSMSNEYDRENTDAHACKWSLDSLSDAFAYGRIAPSVPCPSSQCHMHAYFIFHKGYFLACLLLFPPSACVFYYAYERAFAYFSEHLVSAYLLPHSAEDKKREWASVTHLA